MAIIQQVSPTQAHVQSLGQENAHPNFFKLASRFGVKLCYLGWIQWVFKPNLSMEPLVQIWWNRAIILSQIFTVQIGFQSGPKYKVGLPHVNMTQMTKLDVMYDLT